VHCCAPAVVTVADRSDDWHQARDRQLYHLRHTRDYEALAMGIPIGASKADAKAAYRQLAKARQLDPNQSPNILTLAKILTCTDCAGTGTAVAIHADANVPQMHPGIILPAWACSWTLRVSACGKTRVLPCCSQGPRAGLAVLYMWLECPRQGFKTSRGPDTKAGHAWHGALRMTSILCKYGIRTSIRRMWRRRSSGSRRSRAPMTA